MPKHEIFQKAGEPVTDDVKYLIEKYFSKKEIDIQVLRQSSFVDNVNILLKTKRNRKYQF